MDEPTPRARTPGRRMASAKAAVTRSRTGGKEAGRGREPEISGARWAGVALVVAALVSAIVLAVFSPGDDPGPPQAGAAVAATETPEPTATPVDTRVPTEAPDITTPTRLLTDEWDYDITVAVPKDPLPKRSLDLVILRDGEVIADKGKPKTGGKDVISVRLVEGTNELTAALRGPGGGLGPESPPIEITLDRDAPDLAVTFPEDGHETYDEKITISGQSEPGAKLVIRNKAKSWESPMVVGSSGTFKAMSVPLRVGNNLIVVESEDVAGMTQEDKVEVKRRDGRPFIKRLEAPGSIKRSQLPKSIKVVIDVVDAEDEKMEGATVAYTIGGVDRATETHVDETNAKGRSRWNVEVSGGSLAPVQVTVEVTSPTGQTRTRGHEIAIE